MVYFEKIILSQAFRCLFKLSGRSLTKLHIILDMKSWRATLTNAKNVSLYGRKTNKESTNKRELQVILAPSTHNQAFALDTMGIFGGPQTPHPILCIQIIITVATPMHVFARYVFKFQEDNAPCHVRLTPISEDWKTISTILLTWPAQSSDLNIIRKMFGKCSKDL